MAPSSLKKRWIDAMLKITFSLIDGKRLTGEMGVIVAQCFNEDAPEHPSREVVESLEAEALGLKSFSTLAKERTKVLTDKTPRKQRVSKEQSPNPDDFPSPWCTVKNSKGDVIRYEDANGRAIRKILWPTK